MKEDKKVWIKPELITALRSRPEEAVLAGCKASGVAGLVSGFKVACTYSNYGGGCSYCDLPAGS